MSYGVMAYLLDTKELHTIFNDNNPKKRSLLSFIIPKKNTKDIILENFKSDFDDLDESIRELMENDDEFENPSSSRQILDEFLNNSIKSSSYGFVYGYVFKLLCEYKGTFLDNSKWYPCASESYYGIPFTTYALPIDFPLPDDFPAILYIDHNNIALEEAKYKDMDDEQKLQIIDWFTHALKTKKDIYLFYH